MLERDVLAFEECLFAIKHILEYTEGIYSKEGLIENNLLYDAVQMNFIILGEAASKLSDTAKDSLPNVDWRAIKGFRNFIAHDYFGVDSNVVWSAIKHHLPSLKTDIENLLEDAK